MHHSRSLACALALVLLSFASAPAGAEGEAVDLVIRGMIGGEAAAQLDLAAVMALPSVAFACVDPWDGKQHEFTGVLLSDLLSRVGIAKAATKITVSAKNKYTIPIRRADYERNGYILAYKIDGRLFAEDKASKNRGTFIIAIDFSRHEDLDPQLYKHQLVWQANDILVE